MQTNFSPAQLAKPATAASAAELRKCVHCGFCLATCPTYTLLGDERDSPRGRIYLMKDMLENDRAPSATVVKHVDRCLSCLSCMTTCPSGVNYMHLVDHARAYIERHHRRPWGERLIRGVLAATLPYSGRFRAALHLARLARPLAPLFARTTALRPLAAMLALAPPKLPARAGRPTPAAGRRGTIILLQGCVEPVLRPAIQAATLRLLNRVGYAVHFASGEGCCGALVHHMGREEASLEAARRNVDAWSRALDARDVAAIVTTSSGCGTTIKDYGFMLRKDRIYAERAERIARLVKDISEILANVEMPAGNGRGLTVAYHAACSLQHGQKVTDIPKRLLAAAGFDVRTPAEAHLCCGSAGVYNILQSDIADQLGRRKADCLARLEPDVVAAGNIGCAVQIRQWSGIPAVHTVELLDWATGGPVPEDLSHLTNPGIPK